MATWSTPRILRVPGRICIDPTDSSPLDPENFPYGGTELGIIRTTYMLPFHGGFTVWAEEWGEPSDQLEPHHDWAVGCFLRGWDDDAVAHVFGDTIVGAITQHRVLQIPGTRHPGQRISDRAAKLVFTPLAARDAPAWVAHRALPLAEESTAMALEWGQDLGIPTVWRLTRDTSLPVERSMCQIGRIWDLEL